MKNLNQLLKIASQKNNFLKLRNYSDFCADYLDFIEEGLQARIVCQDREIYQLFQYKEEAHYKISRPINSHLMFSAETFGNACDSFYRAMKDIHSIRENQEEREILNRFVYSCQQSIGATLDGLNNSNKARKLVGDLFERFIQLLIEELGIKVSSQTEKLYNLKFQHDLILEEEGQLKAIGSVKTTSKDRISKIFIDKLLYDRLKDSKTPQFAIFLNDIQKRIQRRKYLTSATFCSGHFKAYTLLLTPLDGVYYCDLPPNMNDDEFLQSHIHTLDYLLVDDIWKF